jgi:hypothetical protein
MQSGKELVRKALFRLLQHRVGARHTVAERTCFLSHLPSSWLDQTGPYYVLYSGGLSMYAPRETPDIGVQLSLIYLHQGESMLQESKCGIPSFPRRCLAKFDTAASPTPCK